MPSLATRNVHEVPQSLIRALFRQPQALQTALEQAGLAPHDLAFWARQSGEAADVEKLAGWLSVGLRPGYYKPLLEVAASHLRSGELLEALPVFHWAYRAWLGAKREDEAHARDGTKLLALWGECLYRLEKPAGAQERWLWALSVVPDAQALVRLSHTMERVGAIQEYEEVLAEAVRRRLPGSGNLLQRWQRLAQVSDLAGSEVPDAQEERVGMGDQTRVAVMADVANLDMVCYDQYGYGRRLDYGRLLRVAEAHGPVCAKVAFVPDIPDTRAIRRHLEGVGFAIDLKQPKRSHGRMVANADTAMAAAAVRWASDEGVGRVELWTGDGDFLKVRETVAEAWPEVLVTFRSFEVGTATGIQRLGSDWMSIGPEYLQVQTMERGVQWVGR